MTVRARPALTGLCLWLGVVSGAAGDAAGAGATPPLPAQGTDAVADRAGAPEPAAPSGAGQAPGPEAEEAEERGLFARIAGWFRGDGAKAHPSPSAPDAGGGAEGAVTLGDVHRAVAELVAEVELLRRAAGAAGAPREAPLREGLAPAHVCVKALEVAEKTARAQRRLGMIPAETASPGVAGLAPGALDRAVRDVIGELRRIKRQLVVEEAAAPAPTAAGDATPSALYRDLAHASLLLDALVGRPPSRGDVRVRIAQAGDALRPLAARLGLAPGAETPMPAAAARAPREVAQALLRATYKAIGLQTALGMDASGVPTAALEGAGEAEALEAASRLLAELLRIQGHLGVEPAPAQRGARDAPPAGAFAQAMRIVAHLDALMRAAPGHGG